MTQLTRDFERFQGGPTPSSHEKFHVTLNQRNVLYMNANTYRKLGKPAAVYLYFSREKDTIVLEPASPRLPQAFPLKEKRNCWLIHATAFCQHFGIRMDTTERFIQPDLDDAGRLVLKLSETVTVRKGPRRSKK